MTVYVANDVVAGGCGIGVLYDFTDYNHWNHKNPEEIIPEGGAGWVIVSFVVYDSKSNEVREKLDKRWDILYESEVRTNRNSGNKCYFVIYDVTKTEEKYGFDDAENN